MQGGRIIPKNRLLFLLPVFLTVVSGAWGLEPPLRILIIHSYDQSLPWTLSFQQGLDAARLACGEGMEYYAESMDTGRLMAPVDGEGLAVCLERKYREVRFDAVLGDSDEACRFLEEHGDFLGDIPRVYYTGDPLELRPTAYSLVSHYDEAIIETFRLAMEQNPEAGELLVITSAVEDGRYVESLLRPLVSRHETLSLRMIRDFTFEELSAEMKALPRSAVVYFTPVVFDRNGDREVPRELLGRLADASGAPFYTFWGSLVGSGAVGGHVIDGKKTAGEMVRAVMDYHRGGAFRDDYRTLTTLFDWKAMRRHGISVEKLPEDATILNSPVSVFVSHPTEILSGVIVVVCLFLALALYSLRVISGKNRQIEEARKEAEELAKTDPLTGLLNRRAAMTFINYEIHRNKRTGGAVSILVLDLDHFKQVNDTYGHEAGDSVLKGVAESLRRSSRETDTVARWGGEELLILLAGTRGRDAAVRAEKIRRQVKELTFPSCPAVTVSIGVAELKPDEGFDEWFRRADAAMYRAKEGGRDRVETAE